MKNKVEKLRMTKPKKNKNKPKLNLTVRDEQRNKLEQIGLLKQPFRLQSYRGYGQWGVNETPDFVQETERRLAESSGDTLARVNTRYCKLYGKEPRGETRRICCRGEISQGGQGTFHNEEGEG